MMRPCQTAHCRDLYKLRLQYDVIMCVFGFNTTYLTCSTSSRSAANLNASTTVAAVRNYNGGGYIFKLTGYVEHLNETIQNLKQDPWTDNRTRALILEFSVYNAQTNLFAMVTCVAEFVGGGIKPYYRIEAVSLFNNYEGWSKIVLFSEIMFVVATFYYLVNLLTVLKKEGFQTFW